MEIADCCEKKSLWSSKDVQLSKALSWLLRHGAAKEGLQLSPEGYLPVATVLKHKSFRGHTEADIRRVVATNEKQRFALREAGNILEIKANQGHTVSVTDCELTPLLEAVYPTVVHGTYRRHWPSIRAVGLSRMTRQHIHLAKGTLEDHTVISGLRQSAEIHIHVDVGLALADGIRFHESANGVILTRGDDNGHLPTKRAAVSMRMECAPSAPQSPQASQAAQSPAARPAAPRPRARRRKPPAEPAADDAAAVDPACMVVVSGFPPYTQPQELQQALQALGALAVTRQGPRVAAVRFGSPAAAVSALKLNRKMIVYGHFVSLRPGVVRQAEPDQPSTPKRDFPRSREKALIVPPEQIALSGEFCLQLDALLAAVRLSEREASALGALYADLEQVLRPHMPGCVAMPFGSITTGLGIKTSDADCFMLVPQAHQARHDHSQHHAAALVNRAKRILQAHPQVFAEILSIPRANTPIVKFYHVPTGTNCDLSFKTPLGAQNSKLIAFLLQADPRLIPLAVAIKYWAKVHQLSGTGKLTNYALTMMIIFYLQQLGVLPSVVALQRDPAHACPVDHWNTGFDDQPLPATNNLATIAELIGGFFAYYSKFDFAELVVCPYLGVPIKKELFRDLATLPDEYLLYKHNVANELCMPMRFMTAVCVQDPFEQSHNVASSVSPRLATDIKAYLDFAAEAHEKGKADEHRGFLKAILLGKPKIVRAKMHPEYRVHLFPKIISAIAAPDWKAVVREIVFTIFERLLKIELATVPAEERDGAPPAAPRKERERYSATVTKAVWKRKQFAKLYSPVKMDFLRKTERVTEEVMNVEKQVLNVPFQLTLAYVNNPKSVGVSVRLQEGDAETFKEFGKFFMSIMQNWFVNLLRPHTRHPERDIAIETSQAGLDSNHVPNDVSIDANRSTDSDDSPTVSQVVIPNGPNCVHSARDDATVATATLDNDATVVTTDPDSAATIVTAVPGGDATVASAEPHSDATVASAEPYSDATVETTDPVSAATIVTGVPDGDATVASAEPASDTSTDH